MNVPKAITTYCPKCRKHTEHTVSLYKQGRQRALSAGAVRHEKDLRGYGGQKFPEQRRTAKTTKKQTLRLKCRTCGYTLERLGIRLRKLEIAA
ncbi:MAG: 50S ribosomal protein L44e [Candidatus Bathyarchaeia archaeon]